jgi:hypothetical protein
VLTAPGTAPVTVLSLRGEVGDLALSDARGRRLAWPARGGVRRALLRDGRDAVIDEVLVVARCDGAELHLHGGGAVCASVLDWLRRAGFVERRVASEGAPGSWRQARAELSARHGPLAALSLSAARAVAAGRLDPGLRRRLERALCLASFADALRRPPVVRIAGPPNAGKSTLFNALLGSGRALASPAPGTTRDAVRARWFLRGVPVVLEDTAGTSGAVPVGAPDVDLVVEVLDRPGARRPSDASLPVLGRSDLHQEFRGPRVSGRTGEGLDQLRHRVADRLGIPEDDASDLLAPVDPAQRGVLAAALALSGRSDPPGNGGRCTPPGDLPATDR